MSTIRCCRLALMAMTDIDDSARPQHHVTVERMLGQRIHAFSNMISGHFFRRTEQPFGVSLPEWRVLRSVLLEPGISQGEIAIAQGLNVMNVSRAVAGLKSKGLIEADPDPEDRRRTMLSPTELGREIGSDINGRERIVYDHVFSVLDDDEVSQLNQLLDRVNIAMREGGLPDPPAPSRDWAALLDRKAKK